MERRRGNAACIGPCMNDHPGCVFMMKRRSSWLVLKFANSTGVRLTISIVCVKCWT